jgi:hypothetical protein
VDHFLVGEGVDLWPSALSVKVGPKLVGGDRVGASTLYKLITGWFELMKEVREATTFGQIREAGERFGKLFSREAAQSFAAPSSAPVVGASDSSSSARVERARRRAAASFSPE